MRQDALNATQTFYTKIAAMRDAASPMIANIKNFADNASDPLAIYTAAEVLPASPKSPVPPPATPVINSAAINGDGSVTIGFDATGATGTVWQVWRQLGTETEYSFIGNADSATKSYTDNTVPAGQSSAQYTIQGVRGSVTGPVGFAIVVKFGGVTGAQDAAAA